MVRIPTFSGTADALVMGAYSSFSDFDTLHPAVIADEKFVIGKLPEFVSGSEVKAAEGVADRVVPVEQIYPPILDGGSAVAPANRNRPKNFRPGLRPGAQQTSFSRVVRPATQR
jgi:hypothetical protein